MGGYAPGNASLPLGVAILAILIGIFGAFFLIVGVLFFLAIGLLGSGLLFGSGVVGAILVLVFGIVLLVVASGLWNQELWALALCLIVLLLLLVGAVLSGTLISLEGLILILLVIYLVAVRHHFS